MKSQQVRRRKERWSLGEAGAIYVFDDSSREFRLRATYGLDDAIVADWPHP